MRILLESFNSVVEKHPEKAAVKTKDKVLSYRELSSDIVKVSHWLRGYGLNHGDRVGIHIQNSIEYVILYYACWSVNLVPVALNTFASKKEIEHWVVNSDCKLLFSEKLDELENMESVDVFRIAEGAASLNDFKTKPEASNLSMRTPDLNDVATIIYTSGTTGNPKGITLTHKNLASNIYAVIKSLSIVSDDVFLCVLPFFYSFGNSILHTHLVSGSTLVLLNNVMYPADILKSIENNRCTGFAGVPSLYISLLKKTEFDQFDLTSLRYMTQAGGPLSKKFITEIHGLLPSVDFVVMYGQTEASARISYLPPEFLNKKMGSVGVGVEGVSIAVLNAEGLECEPMEHGEICISGDNVMIGYWNNADATSLVLKNGILHTGDMGYMDDDGFLYIVGRQSEILKISEHRVSPYEIEEVILQLKEVVECAVIGCEHEQMGQVAKAFVVLNQQEMSVLQIKKFCKQSLASYKIPKDIEFVKSLPKTSSGKIKRSMLQC
ncbi:MAG: acyl--CoA ligase [Gammaproteobacteria bacterium]|nr:acyl--CoA ligase [Gammaproteobacteria bacterium]